MNESEVDSSSALGLTNAGSGAKRAYQKPRIVDRQTLEVFAATCNPGKGVAEPGACAFVVAS